MIFLAIVALILSGGVTYLAYRVLQSRVQPLEVTTKIVVAAKKLDMGYLLTKDDVQLVEWPKSTPLQGSFSDPSQVVDRAVVVPVQINEPIMESKLAPKEAGAGLTAILPQGMRALSIQVNSIIGVAGFVMPGSHVDVILTGIPPKGLKGTKGEETASKIILENLEVIAAGQNVQRDVNGKPQTVQDVTLLLTPQQAEKVALATGDGRIQLALRNPMDKEAAEPPLVVSSTLYTGPTMEKPGDASKAKTSDKSAASEKLLASKKSGESSKTALLRKKAVQEKPPAVAPVAPPPPVRVVVVELIQGARRAKETFEEKNPEQNQTSTPPDRTPQ
jgi:pilus assembly protein CpaB